jgi:hypothetical protein
MRPSFTPRRVRLDRATHSSPGNVEWGAALLPTIHAMAKRTLALRASAIAAQPSRASPIYGIVPGSPEHDICHDPGCVTHCIIDDPCFTRFHILLSYPSLFYCYTRRVFISYRHIPLHTSRTSCHFVILFTDMPSRPHSFFYLCNFVQLS